MNTSPVDILEMISLLKRPSLFLVDDVVLPIQGHSVCCSCHGYEWSKPRAPGTTSDQVPVNSGTWCPTSAQAILQSHAFAKPLL